ncbi:MAG: FecR family protein [Planctomycetota bacterium]
MDRDEFRQLLSRYRDETISESDAHILADAIRNQTDAREWLKDDIWIAGGISAVLNPIDSERLAHSVSARLLSQAVPNTVADRIQEKMGHDEPSLLGSKAKPKRQPKALRQPSVRNSSSWINIGFGAAAAILLIVFASYSLHQTSKGEIALGKPSGEETHVIPVDDVKNKPEALSGIATVRSADVAGGVLFRNGKELLLAAGMVVESGDRVLTAYSSAETAAIIEYPDGSTVELEPLTLAEFSGLDQKAVRIEKGVLTASVARQPDGKPMRIMSPNATATVLGTRLIQTVYLNATRLDVLDGTVEYSNLPTQEAISVQAGCFAIAGNEIEFKSRRREYTPKHPSRMSVVETLLNEPFADRPSSADWKFSGDAPHQFENGLRIRLAPDSDEWIGGNFLNQSPFELDTPLRLSVDATWEGKDEERLVLTFYFMKELEFKSDGEPSNYIRFQTYGRPSKASLQLTRTIPVKQKLVFENPTPFIQNKTVRVRMTIDRTMIHIECDGSEIYYGAHSMPDIEKTFVGIGCGAKMNADGTVRFNNFLLERMQ